MEASSNYSEIESRRQLSWRARSASAAMGILCLVLIVTASRLTPNPAGLGTHRQLGLPPCTSIVLWGTRCPACGMTTSWAWAAQGKLAESAGANLGGLLLFGIALVSVPATCYFSIRGRASQGNRFSLYMACALLAAILAAITQWLLR